MIRKSIASALQPFAAFSAIQTLALSALVVTGLYRWTPALALSGFTMLATLRGFAFVMVASGNLLLHPDR